MKPALYLLLAGLVAPTVMRQQEETGETKGQGDKKKPSPNAMTRFFEGEAERLTQEIEGSWMLIDYTDPSVIAGISDASGFVTFHEGFMTWILSVDSAERTFLGLRSVLILESGAYRYQIDEQANLLLTSVMSFTNNTSNGAVSRERSNSAFEYFTRLDEGVLELREPDGISFTFRRVQSGEFPDSAKRRIEKQRSGTPQWEEDR